MDPSAGFVSNNIVAALTQAQQFVLMPSTYTSTIHIAILYAIVFAMMIYQFLQLQHAEAACNLVQKIFIVKQYYCLISIYIIAK